MTSGTFRTSGANIGVDLGGHTIAAARVLPPDFPGGIPAIGCKVEESTPAGRSIPDVMAALASVICRLAGSSKIDGVGVAIPSMVDADRRHSRKMPNFPPEWDDLDFASELERAIESRGCSMPVRIENDANCYALGEGCAGEAVGSRNYVVFTMGTGIGAGIVLDGRLLTGVRGMAGELGHIVVSGDAPCGCGGKGHTETLAAADGTRLRAEALGLPGDFRELWALRKTGRADSVLDVTIDAMARTVATVYHVLDPELVVIGGGMSLASGMAEAITECAVPYLSRPFKNIIDVRASKLGNVAALFGAVIA